MFVIIWDGMTQITLPIGVFTAIAGAVDAEIEPDGELS